MGAHLKKPFERNGERAARAALSWRVSSWQAVLRRPAPRSARVIASQASGEVEELRQVWREISPRRPRESGNPYSLSFLIWRRCWSNLLVVTTTFGGYGSPLSRGRHSEYVMSADRGRHAMTPREATARNGSTACRIFWRCCASRSSWHSSGSSRPQLNALPDVRRLRHVWRKKITSASGTEIEARGSRAGVATKVSKQGSRDKQVARAKRLRPSHFKF